MYNLLYLFIAIQEGQTALMCACEGGHEKIIQYFLVRGADMNLQRKDGRACLHVACSEGRVGAALLLVRAGSPVDACDKNGLKPFDVAKENVKGQWTSILKAAPFTCACCKDSLEADHLCLCSLYPFERIDVARQPKPADLPQVLAWRQAKLELSNSVMEAVVSMNPSEEKEVIEARVKTRGKALLSALSVVKESMSKVVSGLEEERRLLSCAVKLREAGNVHFDAANTMLQKKIRIWEDALELYSLLHEELVGVQQAMEQLRTENIRELWGRAQDQVYELEETVETLQNRIARNRRRNKEDPASIVELEENMQQLSALKTGKELKSLEELITRCGQYLPELFYEYPELNILYGTAANGYPFRSFLSAYTDMQELDGAADIGRHALFTAILKDPNAHGTEPKRCVLKKYRTSSLLNRQELKRAAHVMASAVHPNVMPLEGIAKANEDGEDVYYLEMPLYSQNLREWIEEHQEGASEEAKVNILRSVLVGLAFLHSKEILHRDIKPENIMLDGDSHPVITDFETSKQTKVVATATITIQGTLGYLDPEFYSGRAEFTDKSDIFSFGVLMGELLFGAKLQNPQEVKELSKKRKKKTKVVEEALLLSLLSPTAADRSSAEELLRHKYFQKVVPLRTCSVCMDENLPLSNGIECANRGEKHFLCNACFVDHVHAESTSEMRVIMARKAEIRCPHARLGCESAAFDELQVARVCSLVPETGLAAHRSLSKALLSLKEQKLAESMEETNKKRLQIEIKRLQELDADQRAVIGHRNEIIEDILTLKCPACSQAFLDFVGCFALSCSKCPCNFCAWCLMSSNDDQKNHAHVVRCERSKSAGQFFGSFDLFNAAQKQRRQQLLNTYFNSIVNRSVRERVKQACKKDFGDWGLVAWSDEGEEKKRRRSICEGMIKQTL